MNNLSVSNNIGMNNNSALLGGTSSLSAAMGNNVHQSNTQQVLVNQQLASVSTV